MANICETTVRLFGDSNRIQQLLQFVKSDKSDFDFNKIIPMPESLNIEDGTKTYTALSYYLMAAAPGNQQIDNIAKCSQADFQKLLNCGLKPVEYDAEFYRKIKEEISGKEYEEFLQLGKTAAENYLNYGCLSWYDWCNSHWGSKWNAEEVSAYGNEISFQTPWGHPTAIMLELSRLFPDIIMVCLIDMMDGGWGYALVQYESGKAVKENDDLVSIDDVDEDEDNWDEDDWDEDVREAKWLAKERKQWEAKMNKVPFSSVSSVTISGKAFVLTGQFEGYESEKREKVQEMIVAKGGRCTGSVSGKTDYVVVGDRPGEFGEKKIEDVKLQRAKGNDVKIIHQAELMKSLLGKAYKEASQAETGKTKTKEPDKTDTEDVWEALEQWSKEAKLRAFRFDSFDLVQSVTISGKSFVLTGVFDGYSYRSGVEALVVAAGGACSKTVSLKTDYVVIGALGEFNEKIIDDVKAQREKGSGVKIIRQADLFDALNGKSAAKSVSENTPSRAEKGTAVSQKEKSDATRTTQKTAIPEKKTATQKETTAPEKKPSVPQKAVSGTTNNNSSQKQTKPLNQDDQSTGSEQEGTALASSIRSKTRTLKEEFDRRAKAQAKVLANGGYYGMSDPRLNRDLQAMDRIVNDCGAKGEKLLNDSLNTFNRIKGSLSAETASSVVSALENLIDTVEDNRAIERSIGLVSRYTWKTNIDSVKTSLRTSRTTQKAAVPEKKTATQKKTAASEKKPTTQKKAAVPEKTSAVQKYIEQQEKAKAKKEKEDAIKRKKAELEKEIEQTNSHIRKLKQTKAEKERKLGSLGLFKWSEKGALRNEIDTLQKDITAASTKLSGMKVISSIASPIKYYDRPVPGNLTNIVYIVAGALRSGTENAMTASEIRDYTGTNLTSLNVAQAVQYLEDVYSVKVLRARANEKGEYRMVEETAYFLSK